MALAKLHAALLPHWLLAAQPDVQFTPLDVREVNPGWQEQEYDAGLVKTPVQIELEPQAVLQSFTGWYCVIWPIYIYITIEQLQMAVSFPKDGPHLNASASKQASYWISYRLDNAIMRSSQDHQPSSYKVQVAAYVPRYQLNATDVIGLLDRSRRSSPPIPLKSKAWSMVMLLLCRSLNKCSELQRIIKKEHSGEHTPAAASKQI